MTPVIGWYLSQLVVGAAGLLPAAVLFGRLHSRGVGYARPLALALLALAVWLLTFLTRVPYGTPTIVALLGGLLCWSAWIGWRRPTLMADLWAARRRLLGMEALFLALFLLLTLVRAQAPDALATEKPMELMLLTAVHGAAQLPPPDVWFAGETVAYYHLGYVGADVAGRLGGTGPATTFTLALPLAGATAGVAVFALAGDIAALTLLRAGSGWRQRRAWWVAGGGGVFALLLVAPLTGLAGLLAANGVGARGWWEALGVSGLPAAGGATNGIPDGFWWWWGASRSLPGVITEFPAFSLLLGDVHAHVLALPLAVLVLALATTLVEGGIPLTPRRWFGDRERLVLFAVPLAALGMTNLWDLPLYAAVLLLAATVGFMQVGWRPGAALAAATRGLALPAALAGVLLIPFLGTLDPPPGGLAAVTGAGSDPTRFALTWLPLALPVPLLLALRRPPLDRRVAAVAAAGGLGMVLVWAGVVLAGGDDAAMLDRGWGWVTLALLVMLAAAGAGICAAALRGGERALVVVSGLGVFVATMVLATELVYIVDAFDSRVNTVFKTWYGGWLMLAVASGAALTLATGPAPVAAAPASRAREADALAPAGRRPLGTRALTVLHALTLPRLTLPRLLLGTTALLLVASAAYLPAATVSRAREPQQSGLDSLAFLRHREPEVAALVSAAAALPAGSVLLEGVGRSYGDNNRVSAFSGTQALLGWPGHELQWRDQATEIARRAEVLNRIYATADAALARSEGATHLVIGPFERGRYGSALLERFAGWPVVASVGESGGGLLLAVPPAPAAPTDAGTADR